MWLIHSAATNHSSTHSILAQNVENCDHQLAFQNESLGKGKGTVSIPLFLSFLFSPYTLLLKMSSLFSFDGLIFPPSYVL